MSGAAFFREVSGGVSVDVRLTPKGGRDAIDGVGALSDGRSVLLARVRAVPEKGAANQALEALVAGALDMPRSSVAVVSGHTARIKTLKIAGETTVLLAKLEVLARP